MARHIGIDLHRNRFTVCTLAENGRAYHRTVEIRHLVSFAAGLRRDDEVAVEMTTNTRLFKNTVEPYVARVVVVDPWKFKVISESVKKTDKHDAEQLAFFLSKQMLPELRMKDRDHEKLHSLCQTRDKLVKQRTQLKNKINNVLEPIPELRLHYEWTHWYIQKPLENWWWWICNRVIMGRGPVLG